MPALASFQYTTTCKGLRHLTSMGGCPQRTRGSSHSHSARAQGRYSTPRGYAPLESTAIVAVGNQCDLL